MSLRDLTDKQSHLDVCADADVQCRRSNGFDRYELTHRALPELDLEKIDTSTTILGRRLAAPVLFAPMSGGIDEGRELTRALAGVAQQLGLALALGSQRIAIERPEMATGFAVRDIAPDILLLANLGAVNLNCGYGPEQCREAVVMAGADGLMLHLNAVQEAIQGGDTRFAGLIDRIKEVCAVLAADRIPVFVREVSCGLSAPTLRAIEGIGVAGIDTGGVGGTSWPQVEGCISSDPVRKRAGEVFRDWGSSTCESLEAAAAEGFDGIVIASGGIRTGIDIATALALKASLCGVATPFLQAWRAGGEEAVELLARQLCFELKVAMFATGASKITELQGAASPR